MFTHDIMGLIVKQFARTPFYGSRRMTKVLRKLGYCVNRKRVRRVMKNLKLQAIYPKPRTSRQNVKHKVYPYLLTHVTIDKPNQVWCTDITYIPVQKGYMYLVAIMDWYSRKVLSWRLSNTMDTDFCIEALNEALQKYPKPTIFNTDQGSQFTSHAFTDVLKANSIRISMDSIGAWRDNVYIERLWRSLKYECLYLNEFQDGRQARQEIRAWMRFYNFERPHTKFGLQTPSQAYIMYCDKQAVPPMAPTLAYHNATQFNQQIVP